MYKRQLHICPDGVGQLAHDGPLLGGELALSLIHILDGIHIARFYENLDRELAALCGGEKTEY